MKTYLVGGAVRDQLLGYPVHERDWVVVGGTPNDLLSQGYQQVGRDFPVFLHPKTREEYALARTERKLGPGYYGFQCDCDPTVTLEEDLARRDLTINAMAMDTSGQLIDPYHGLQDLETKKLRHVSQAFVEDPVRVLRVARFAARYHHLGFTIANETRALMYAMVRQGELEHLVPERVWQEWHGSLHEQNPELFISTLRACDALRVILPELDRLFGMPNPRTQHPEVDTGIHTLMALKQAVTLTKDPLVRFATLLHDVGKACTNMTQWPLQQDHDVLGLPVIDAMCQRLRIPANYRKFAWLVAKFHLIIHQIRTLDANTLVSVLEHTDAFRRPQLFHNMLMVCEADSRGRPGDRVYSQTSLWHHVLTECGNISVKSLMKQGLIEPGSKGDVIKSSLHQHRVARVELIIQEHYEK
jgi:tRNA nucleotidyltransferase (CCA-adding enzyme)